MTDIYKLERFTDIVKIPPEAFERFQIELKDIYTHFQGLKMIADVSECEISDMLPFVEWRDDNSSHIDVEFSHEGKTIAELRINGSDSE